MAYDTWDWDQAGYPNRGFQPIRKSPRLMNSGDAGYAQTRPLWTRDLWTFNLEYSVVYPEGFIYIVNFWHSMRGGALFYLPWPVGLYGIPPEYYTADPGGLSPWSSEVEPGYGEGPTHLVRFGMDDLSLSRVAAPENYWFTVAPIVFEQV